MRLVEKLKNSLLIGTGVALMTVLSPNAQAQDNKDILDKSFTIGISGQSLHDIAFDDYFGEIPGIYAGGRMKLMEDIYGSIHTLESFGKDKDKIFRARITEIAPHIEWHPGFMGVYVGAGFKYRLIRITNTETNEFESIDGIGISTVFGSNIFFKKFYVNLETGYDLVKGSYSGEEIDLGSTRFSLSIGL